MTAAQCKGAQCRAERLTGSNAQVKGKAAQPTLRADPIQGQGCASCDIQESQGIAPAQLPHQPWGVCRQGVRLHKSALVCEGGSAHRQHPLPLPVLAPAATAGQLPPHLSGSGSTALARPAVWAGQSAASRRAAR